jgi:hypothetical protein
MQEHNTFKAMADVAATLGAAVAVANEVAMLLTPLLTFAVTLLTMLWWLLRLREMMALRAARMASERQASDERAEP